MPALPPSSDFTGSTRTNAQMKTTFADLRAFLADLLGADGTPAAALAALGSVGQAGAQFRSVATTLTAADRGRTIHALGGTWTLTLPALSSLDPGWSVLIRNEGAGTITLQPQGGDLIDYVATGSLPPGSAVLLTWSPARWRTFVMGAMLDQGRALRSGEVIANSTDATSGRLLALAGNTGAFGLGASYAPLLANLDDILTPAGLYLFNMTGGTSGTGPGFNQGAVIVAHAIGSGTRAPQQIAIQRSNTGGGRLAWRTSQGGTWGAWQTAYGTGNAVGTVSQSGGAPTGALVETGTNANGRYRRLACGTQECWRSMTASAAAATTWTFPAAFSEAPIVRGTAVAGVMSAVCLDAAPGTASCSFSARDKTDARRADTVHLHAVGRWF